ncbi:hypothetical protein SGFS_005510 [Streptomyces graminofaciens]|uniref:Polyketide synthase-like methyltransferase domain-containing protein n=1 Tax=Streptomyces graminofaciens TaxID=68212 RepID=A0ABN5V7I7_9ACTN|nr:methyltransferase domain-containing protein [Streptomyces graminofaciens]BBC29260.1 hypothetical protein SGFS_005510 [Streptomyces graminofaciens]
MFDSYSVKVGEYYDQVNDLTRTMFEDNIHFGYWADPLGGGSLAEAGEAMTGQVIARLEASAGHTVLDVGCGVGKPAVRLARETGAVVKGVNVSRNQIEVANSLAQAEGLQDRLVFEIADAMNLPYADDSFDRVWALESMFHMPDRGQVMGEMARVLKPGGRLVIADLVLHGTLDDTAAAVVEQFCFQSTARSVEHIENYPRLVEKAGLELIDLTDVSEETRSTGEAVAPTFDMLLDAIGEEGVAAAKKTWTGLFDLPQYGYALLTARKP